MMLNHNTLDYYVTQLTLAGEGLNIRILKFEGSDTDLACLSMYRLNAVQYLWKSKLFDKLKFRHYVEGVLK